MDMLLPKGIVENTSEIYAEVAGYPVVPPEKICEYWNVYTTTFRRLVDPTAYRLENFWWHVWGSDRRYLSGPALAKLFEEISNGPTIVPIRGPPNRYDGSLTFQLGPGAPPSLDKSQGQNHSRTAAEQKAPTPSSTRPPPPHPILKKNSTPIPRPRPTARFASPPPSNKDNAKDGEEKPSSTVGKMPPPPPPSSKKRGKSSVPETAAARTEMRPPPASSSTKLEKSTAPPTRKVVAATAATKRKPVMMRRQSSQSSTGSDAGSRATITKYLDTQRQSSNATEQRRRSSQGSSASSQASQITMPSAKAAGKKPADAPSTKATTPEAGISRIERPITVVTEQEEYFPSPKPGPVTDPKPTTRPNERSQREVPQHPPPVAGFVADQGFRNNGPTSPAPSRTDSEGSRRVQRVGGLVPPQVLSPETVVELSNTTVQGQFSESLTSSSLPEETDIPDSVLSPPRRPSSSALQDWQFSPTPPSSAPPIPFGRSKSQLTLLLENDKTKGR